MTPEKIRRALERCGEICSSAGATHPERLDEEARGLRFNRITVEMPGDATATKQLNHVLYITKDGHELLSQERFEKAHRHLGWAQGALWALGLVSIEELLEMNRPDDRSQGRET